ncbi:MAG TPA: alginate export family protein [Acidobacteriota bacterium]|nr:alginate export family protein [Acidobacteriota bacterium]
MKRKSVNASAFRCWLAMIVISLCIRGVVAIAQEEPVTESPDRIGPPKEMASAGAGAESLGTPGPRPVAPSLSASATLRARFEIKRGVRFDEAQAAADEDFTLSRLRLHLTWAPARWEGRLAAFIELQDARIWGEDFIDEKAVPNLTSDQLDIHQAHLDVGLAPDSRLPAKLRVGRQKLNLGAQRLVASLEWANTARVWDGARLTLGDPQRRGVDFFATRLVPVRPDAFNDHAPTGSRMFDSQLHGVYFTDKTLIRDAQLEAYWLMRFQGAAGDNVHTFGLRAACLRPQWDADMEVARQFGTFGGQEHRAMMLHVGIGHTLKAVPNSHIGAAYNFGSGDRNASDARHETFDNLFPLNHAYYGHMDFFALQNLHNAELVFKTRLSRRVSLRAAYQRFYLAQEDSDAWYDAGGRVFQQPAGDLSPDAGSEIDLTLSFDVSRFKLVVGHSRFFTGQYLRDAGTSTQSHFSYAQMEVGF